MKEQLSSSLPTSNKKGPLQRLTRPFVLLGMHRMDAIGEAVRASPFLLLVIVLDGTIAINDFALPSPHMLYKVHAFFFPPPPIP